MKLTFGTGYVRQPLPAAESKRVGALALSTSSLRTVNEAAVAFAYTCATSTSSALHSFL
jgi:hypothetical protein